jgi:thioredoxin 1
MSEIVDVTDANFEAEVLKSTHPVLVDFSATWCEPCKKLEPIVHEIAGEFAGRLKVVRVDVDQARSSAARYAVMSVPSVFLFKDGQVKDHFVGVLAKAQIAERVRKVL